MVHTRTVNERNQVVVSIRAASTSSLNPEEPRSLTALGYETRTHDDANDNVVKVEVENVVDQGGATTSSCRGTTGSRRPTPTTSSTT